MQSQKPHSFNETSGGSTVVNLRKAADISDYRWRWKRRNLQILPLERRLVQPFLEVHFGSLCHRRDAGRECAMLTRV